MGDSRGLGCLYNTCRPTPGVGNEKVSVSFGVGYLGERFPERGGVGSCTIWPCQGNSKDARVKNIGPWKRESRTITDPLPFFSPGDRCLNQHVPFRLGSFRGIATMSRPFFPKAGPTKDESIAWRQFGASGPSDHL